MIFGKSLKQMRRTPVTTVLFIVLFAVAAFFISSGAVIWARNQATLKAYEDVFVTIGTVRQRATGMELTERWDAATKDYTRKSRPTYTGIIPASVMDFDGVDYIHEPERRPYYGAWQPDLQLWPTDAPNWMVFAAYVVEVTPLEDCVPDNRVEVRVERVLSENPQNATLSHYLKAGDIIPLCDHENDNPQPLYAGKIYLVHVVSTIHDSRNVAGQQEWRPQPVTFSSQYNSDGTRIEGSIASPSIVEVTDGFYETELGRRWLEFAGVIYNPFYTLPVLPTNATHLLLPFYNGTASIVDGEDITPEEYENGERVCLVTEKFARNNNLSPGDALRLPLYYADYVVAPNDEFQDFDVSSNMTSGVWLTVDSPLNAAGEPYSIFSDHEYVIKGIYSSEISSDASFAMGANVVVIPAKSVQENDENNIRAYGPMKDTTTTFQIPNGSIEAFMERWLEQGIEDLEFTFHDRGYTQLHRGLENMKRISMLFLAIGAAMSLALVFFFCYVFISKNKMRTAVERMLGYTKRQCAVSLLSGFLLAAVLAVAIGCAAGVYAEGKISSGIASKEYYDTRYTIGPLGQDGVELSEDITSAFYAPVAGIALLLATCLISAAFMRGNVHEEPLKLLSGKKE